MPRYKITHEGEETIIVAPSADEARALFGDRCIKTSPSPKTLDVVEIPDAPPEPAPVVDPVPEELPVEPEG